MIRSNTIMRKAEHLEKDFKPTSSEEASICLNCPFDKPTCGLNGCGHFKSEKASLLEKRSDRRRLRGKRVGGRDE